MSRGWPLNQTGAPAASVTPLTGVAGSGTMRLGWASPRGVKVTVWKPLMSHLTLSPRRMVVTRRK